LLLAVSALVPAAILTGSASAGAAYSEAVLYDGTAYHYETFGSDQSTYRSAIRCAETDADGIYIPTVLEGYNVTTIAENAFAGCPSIRYAVIPERVTAIEKNAFAGCTHLESVYFMGSAPAINTDAFPAGAAFRRPADASGWSKYSSSAIEEITVTSPDGSAVDYYIIEGEAMAVGGRPSADGTVVLTSNVSGGGNTYQVTSIGPYSFSGHENESNTRMIPKTDIKRIISADGIKIIRERAFFYNTRLETVESTNTVEVIADEAFRAASFLTSSSMISSDNIGYIGFEAFRECRSLQSIHISDATAFIGEGAFKICSGAEYLKIGNGLMDIPAWAFAYCTSLTAASVGSNVKTIGSSAFYMCGSLRSVSIPNSVTSIGPEAFYACDSMKSISLGNSLAVIGRGAFMECSLLNGVRVPGTVTSVQSKAFAYCSGMTDIHFAGEMPEFGDSVFLNTDATVHYKEKHRDSWTDFNDKKAEDKETNITAILVSAAIIITICVVYLTVYLRRP
jgi:hypothetical protein